MSHRSPTDRLVRAGGTADRPIYYDDRRGTYHTWYEGGTYEPVTTAVLMAVSEALETDLESLEPLAAAVDPEALDDLFTRGVRPQFQSRSQSRSRGGTNALVVSFEYAECRIRIHESGEIVIDPRKRG
ncbi:HalOD1 output domain-containing protein [Natronosalvus caseinilyticus]|uniref:HalOD1 output domain-containing protein n=1 Tax=Natronosalvus caseinilyticus TaxID=2953747 RepID=UPI0028A960C3|nr:HalOD1 output domain-containing protein [Natronosalvus caseinilyticus]